MTRLFRWRLGALVAAILTISGATILGLLVAWHRVKLLQARLTTSQIERFQLASEVRRELQSLNSSMLSYVLVRDPRQWEHFEKVSGDLDKWIDNYDPDLNSHSVLSTEAEQRIFKELNRAYDDYLSSARAVRGNAEPAMVTPAQWAQLDAFNAQAERMREFVRRLTDAHRAAEAQFLAGASASIGSLRGILIGGVVLVLALAAATGWLIYGGMIAPLRTKLVHSQSLLERQEKLATLGTLAAGIAHEIRNPLTSLKARVYTLEKHFQAVPAAKRDTDIINAEIVRLERIVQDVLSFAQPGAPKLGIVRTDTLLYEVRELMMSDLALRGVRLEVESAPNLRVNADSGHLKQVLINLIRNGAEAIDGSGTVTLRAAAGRDSLGGRDCDIVLLEVCDTGKGIARDAEKRLFDPFFSTKESGTGLGLSIAARIVDRHGGAIQYQTHAGRGTTFWILLPASAEEPERNALPAAGRASACDSLVG